MACASGSVPLRGSVWLRVEIGALVVSALYWIHETAYAERSHTLPRNGTDSHVLACLCLALKRTFVLYTSPRFST